MSVRKNLQRGTRATWAGQRREALDSFRAVLREDPLNETAFLWLCYLIGDFQGRLACVTWALKIYLYNCRSYAVLWWAWRSAIGLPEKAAFPFSPIPQRRKMHPAAVGLVALGCLWLGVLAWPAIHSLVWVEPPAVVAAVGLLSPSPPPQTATVLLIPPASPSPISASTSVPTWMPAPTLAPTPDATPTSSPTPPPTLAPTPAPAGLVVPAPFPIPGPHEFVPSTTLMIPTPVMPVPVASDAINIVVLGSDQRPDWSEWHTDVVQVVSIQRDHGAVSVISVPRDLYVYIPGLWMSRINFADLYGETYGYEGGGPALVRDTLLYNLGIRVDYYVRTNFDGLIGIVDTVGGVDIPVHCRLSDHWPYPDENGEYPFLTLEPGVHHLDGETALWYARSRKTSSVFARERRQQQVLQALWHKARDTEMLTQAPALWQQCQDMVQTDLGIADVLALARVALTLDDRNVRFYNIGAGAVTPWTTPYGGAVFLPRWEAVEPIVAEAMAPIPEARLTRTFLPVEVWNGTPNQDWDLLAADRLYRAGLPAVIGQPDQRDYPTTRLIVFSEQVKGDCRGYLQQIFHISDDQVIYQPGMSSEFGFRLILGADYQTCPQP